MVLLRLAMVALCGLLFYFVEPGSSLFSWHPTLMTIGSMMLLYEGILLLSPDNGILKASDRNIQRNMHGLTQLLGSGIMFLGFVCCAMHKIALNKPHFTTLHGVLGLTAGILTTFQCFGGLAVRYQLRNNTSSKYMRFGHTIAALVQYFAISMAYLSGINSKYLESRIMIPILHVALYFLPILAYSTGLKHILYGFLQVIINPK